MTIEQWTYDNNLAKNNWLEQPVVYYSLFPNHVIRALGAVDKSV